jgi:hypothetical protein
VNRDALTQQNEGLLLLKIDTSFVGVIAPDCKVMYYFRNGDFYMKHASFIMCILTQLIVADNGNHISLVLRFICSDGPVRVLCHTVRNIIISCAGSI